MTATDEVLDAARNNAEWCDAICRAHGAPGRFHASYWVNHGKVPPYIPNLITLAGPKHAAEHLAAVRDAVEREPELDFSIKDAFQCLDLAPRGFVVLFDATWIYRRPGAPLRAAGELEWSIVGDPHGLAEWERAWGGNVANPAVGGRQRTFVPRLLQEPGLHFLAGRRGGVTIASGALNRTGDVVGLSNVFSAAADSGPLFPGCVRLAQQLYPRLPIVGYERGDDLIAAEQAGFTRIGELTVWRRPV